MSRYNPAQPVSGVTQAVSADDFILQHYGSTSIGVSITGGDIWQSSITTPIAAGIRNGQELTIQIIASAGYSSAIELIRTGGNLSLVAPWVRNEVGHWIKLRWNNATSTWYEVSRDIPPTINNMNGNVVYHRPVLMTADQIAASQYYTATGDWTNDGFSSLSLDTTNVLISPNSPPSAIKAVCNGFNDSSLSRIISAAGYDMTGWHVAQWVYIYPGTEGETDSWRKLENLQLWFVTGTNIYTNCYQWPLWTGSPTDASMCHPGWNLFTGIVGSAMNTVGSPDLTQINRLNWMLRDDEAYNKATVVTFGPTLFYTPPNAKGIICITADGSWSSQAKMAKYANAKGIPFCFNTNPNSLGNDGLLTSAQLRDLLSYGMNGAANYTYSFEKSWATMTEDQRIASIELSGEKLKSIGQGHGARCVSPNGSGTAENNSTNNVEQNIFGKYIDIPIGFNNPGGSRRGGQSLFSLNALRMYISPGNILTDDSNGNLAGTLANAKNSKAVAIEVWHGVDDGSFPTFATFTTHIDAIAAEVTAGTVEALLPMDIVAGRFTRA